MPEERKQGECVNEIIQQICDRDTVEAIGRLGIVNENKCANVKERVVQYFKDTKRPVSYEAYRKIIAELDRPADISVLRRNNLYDLEDIDDFEGI